MTCCSPKNPHLTVTLFPPITMGAEREKQLGDLDRLEIAWQSPVWALTREQKTPARESKVPAPALCPKLRRDVLLGSAERLLLLQASKIFKLYVWIGFLADRRLTCRGAG